MVENLKVKNGEKIAKGYIMKRNLDVAKYQHGNKPM